MKAVDKLRKLSRNQTKDWYFDANTASEYYDIAIYPLLESVARHGFCNLTICLKDVPFLLPDAEVSKLEEMFKDQGLISQHVTIDWDELLEFHWEV